MNSSMNSRQGCTASRFGIDCTEIIPRISMSRISLVSFFCVLFTSVGCTKSALLSTQGLASSNGKTSAGTTSSNSTSAPGQFSYLNDILVLSKGSAMASDSLSVSAGGTGTVYSVSPSLPAGLTIDKNAGTISGTPTALSPMASYVVEASNSLGSTSEKLTISVNDIAPIVVYSALTCTVNNFCSMSPTNSGGAIVGALASGLPAGLTVSNLGVISGTPTAITAGYNYSVTLTNSGGSTSNVTININVNDLAPSVVYSALTCAANNFCSMSPTNSGGTITTASAVGLPAGLAISSSGVISGTPTTFSASTSYSVTLTNSVGSTSGVTINITVNAAPTLSYSNAVGTAGSLLAVTPTSLTANATSITGCSISPTTLGGATISVNATSCVLSVTPGTYAASQSYTVTATNSASITGTATVNLGANAPPALSYAGATGTTGSVGASMTVSPSTLTAHATSITGCIISPTTLASVGVNINATTCVISGTPTSTESSQSYVVTATNSAGLTTTTSVTLAITEATYADHLVLVSGNSQSGYPGAALSQSLKIQVLDQFNNPWTGGLTLGLMRMLGVDNTGSLAKVTTDSSGYANFQVSLGYSPDAWQIVPSGSSLPNTQGTSCGAGNSIGFSCGTKIGFSITPTIASSTTFATQSTSYSTGNLPYKIRSGDFNSDGKLDVIVINNDSTRGVSVLLGNGDGTFKTQSTYLAGSSQLWGLSVGDFNGDGIVDFVAVDNGSTSASVFLGNGNGTFQAGASLATGVYPSGAAVMDANNDGNLDLIVLSNVSTLNIFLGNGNGTFQAPSTVSAGSGPRELATGDFNGDGSLDLAVVNQNDNSVSILLGNGNGTFQTQTTYNTGTFPVSIAVGDFNGDGFLDLATSNQNSNNVTVFLGNGNGTFRASSQSPISVGNNPDEIVVGYFNGNNHLDIATANNGTNTGVAGVSVLLGNGDGTFAAQATYSSSSQGFPKSLAVGDFNGDYILDLAVVNNGATAGTNGLTVLLGQ